MIPVVNCQPCLLPVTCPMNFFMFFYPSIAFQATTGNQPDLSSEQILNPTIAVQVETEEKIEQIRTKLQRLHRDDRNFKKTHWTSTEDAVLINLVEVKRVVWKNISRYFQNRTQDMCYSRYRRLSQECKGNLWTKEEEAQIFSLVEKNGEKWKRISQQMRGSNKYYYLEYTSKQIRERYLNYLKPNLNKECFSLEEDLQICEYVLKNGHHWRKLEKILIGRPEGLIKNRFYGKLKNIIEPYA